VSRPERALVISPAVPGGKTSPVTVIAPDTFEVAVIAEGLIGVSRTSEPLTVLDDMIADGLIARNATTAPVTGLVALIALG
jgi:hypothetical protein